MTTYQETLWKSDHNLKRLRSFRTRRWSSSNQLPNDSTETFWQLRSNVKYVNFLEVLKMDLFFNGLSTDLQQCLFDAPGVLDDRLFVDLLRAYRFLQTNSSGDIQSLLRTRLNILQRAENRSIWNKNLLYTLKGNLAYEIQLNRVAIRKVKKFSGWVRNSSAVGSKRRSSFQGYNPEIFGVILDEKYDYFEFLVTPVLDNLFPEAPGINILDFHPNLINSLIILKLSQK